MHNYFCSVRHAFTATSQPAKGRRERARRRLVLEALEDRLVPSVTVTTPLDTTIANQISLRQAIAMVNAGQVADNTINLPAGNYLNLTGALDVTHALILQGAGPGNTIIDGGGTDRVFLVNPATGVTVQFSSVTIRDGSTGGSGGGIFVQDASGQSSSLTLMDSIVTGNTVNAQNSSSLYGGGIALNNGNVTLTDTQVTDNQVLGSDDWGGGVGDANEGTGNITATNSLIAGNTAGSAGGGIGLFDGQHGNLTITGSSISDNTLTAANYGGGGIFINTLGALSIKGSSINGNTSELDGGGIDVEFANPLSITLSNDTITRNHSTQGNGGGIANNTNAALTAQGDTIALNSAALSGGGVSEANNDFGTDNFIMGSVVTQNTAAGTGGGGGLSYLGAGGFSITNSTVSDNIASAGPGGGLLVTDANATPGIAGSTFSGNVAATNGGAVEDDSLSLLPSNSTFDNNQARNGQGGAIHLNGGAAQNVTLVGVTLRDNAATGASPSGFGGALAGSVGILTLDNCLLLNNSATFGAGAVSQSGGMLTISNSQFTGNVAGNEGGAVFFEGAAFAVSGTTFNSNGAVSYGGALFYSSGLGTPTLTNDTFTGNTAGTSGGAIDDNLGHLAFVNDTINGNTAAGGDGGGVAIFSTGVTFQNTIVVQDTAPSNFDGPDVYIGAGDTVTDKGGNYVQNVAVASGNTGFGPFSPGNPALGPLEDNGGAFAGAASGGQIVQTEAVLPGSLTIGKGVSSGAPATDERGFPRPGPAGVSIGAYEPQYSASANANQLFVENVYEVLLNRPADPGGLASWSAQLQQGTSPSAVVAAIEGSSEYRTDLVQSLYQRYLHRAADPSGLQTFVMALGGTMTVEQVSAALVGSQEYFQLHGSNDQGFLDALYEDALNRLPDPSGLSMFSQALASGTSRSTVATMVFGSKEFQTNLVEADYAALLGRPADSGGLITFLNLLSSGPTDQTMVADILGSNEAFSKRT